MLHLTAQQREPLRAERTLFKVGYLHVVEAARPFTPKLGPTAANNEMMKKKKVTSRQNYHVDAIQKSRSHYLCSKKYPTLTSSIFASNNMGAVLKGLQIVGTLLITTALLFLQFFSSLLLTPPFFLAPSLYSHRGHICSRLSPPPAPTVKHAAQCLS